jgi:hypothetical protein
MKIKVLRKVGGGGLASLDETGGRLGHDLGTEKGLNLKGIELLQEEANNHPPRIVKTGNRKVAGLFHQPPNIELVYVSHAVNYEGFFIKVKP